MIQGGDGHAGHALGQVGVQRVGLTGLVVVGVGHLDLIAQVVSGGLIAGGQQLEELVLLEHDTGDELVALGLSGLAALGGVVGLAAISGGCVALAAVVGGVVAAAAGYESQGHAQGQGARKDLFHLVHRLPPRYFDLYFQRRSRLEREWEITRRSRRGSCGRTGSWTGSRRRGHSRGWSCRSRRQSRRGPQTC